MNELKARNYNGQKVIDSRDVAAMVERSHNELLKSIRTYIAYLNEGEIPHVKFFIESSYVDKKGQEQPCYLITRKGCDMIANKTPGKKGVLFTAAYVTAFEEMAEAIKKPALIPDVSPGGLAELIRVTRRVMLDMGSTPQDVGYMVKSVFNTFNVPVPVSLEKQVPGQLYITGMDRGPCWRADPIPAISI